MMNPLSSDSVQHAAAAAAAAGARPVDDAFVLVHGGAVMPDVIRPAPAATNSAARTHTAASSLCHVCPVTCRHHTPPNNSSSSSSAAAAAADYNVTYASRDNVYNARQTEPLPDLVNVHRPASSSPYEYDRPSTSATVVYHAANVNHCMPPQPPTSTNASHSPTHRCVRGTLRMLPVSRMQLHTTSTQNRLYRKRFHYG